MVAGSKQNAVGGLLLLVAGQVLATAVDPNLPYNFASTVEQYETCWERCFQIEDTDYERFREIYDDLYRMGMEGRRLKNIYGVNGTALMLDSTLAAFHSDAAAVLDAEDQAASIWQLQKDLAAIAAFLIGSDNDHNPFYITQFNEASAYGCDEMQCLDACEVDYSIENLLDNLQTEVTSSRKGNVEAACGLSKRYMQSTECTATPRNEMAIAFLNSNIWSKLDSSSSSSSSESMEYSQGPCFAHFDTRYAVGTHAAGWEEIEEFSTNSAKGFYIHDNEYTMIAAKTLRQCLSNRCCPTTATFWTAPSVANCKITSGPYGDTETGYPNHAGIGGP